MFSDKRKHRELSDEEEKDRLYQKIGQLEVELDWAKKNSDFSISKKREFIEPEHPKISIQRQCEILDLNRSSLYYSPRPIRAENQKLMNMMDEIYTDHPYYGYRRIREVLKRKGLRVNRKRVHRLMNLLGLQGICPKRNLSKPRKDHKKYPYLLRGVPIERSNQVLSSDITYCRLKGGYVYLTAVMDWFTKKVLSWRVSNSMEASFCIEALTEALNRFGKPEIFNMDQGPQYTSNAFLSILGANEIQISMDGRGRALDNVFVERLWRSVKYENIYLNEYSSVSALKAGLEEYFRFHNQDKPHQSLGYQTPDEVYESKAALAGFRVPRLLLQSLDFIHGTGKLEKKTLQECVVILNTGGRIPTSRLEIFV